MIRQGFSFAAAAMAVLLGFAPAYAADPPQTAPKTTADTYRQLDLFGEVFERVRSDYVENVTDEQLEYALVTHRRGQRIKAVDGR